MPFDAVTGQWTDTPNYNYNWFSGMGQQPALSHSFDTGGQQQQPGMIGNGSVPAIVPRPPAAGGIRPDILNQQPPPPPPSATPPPSADSGLGYYNGRDMRYLNPYTYSAPPPPRHPDLGTSVNMPAPATGFLPQPGGGGPAPGPANGLPQPTPGPQVGAGLLPGQQGQYDIGQAKYDPAYLAQIQSALESQNGPYAGRQVGDYAPATAPLGIQNPQTQKDWVDRFYWFAAHPEYLQNPTAPRQTAVGQRDYTMPFTVPGQEFDNNLYADSNAQQSFLELQGVLTPDKLAQVRQVYGWQGAAPGFTPDENAAYRAGDTLARQDPDTDFSIIKVLQPDGSIGYGIEKRSRIPAAPAPPPEAPIVAARAASGGGGGGRGGGGRSYAQPSRGYPPRASTARALPAPSPARVAPVAPALPKPAPSIDTRMVGGQVNMGQPVEGQIISYNGQMVQYRNGRWEPYAYNGGVGQHVSPV
jgi:hypothetical protein